MFICLECGKKFRKADAARRAMNVGCPKCGGSDIDVDVNAKAREKLVVSTEYIRYECRNTLNLIS